MGFATMNMQLMDLAGAPHKPVRMTPAQRFQAVFKLSAWASELLVRLMEDEIVTHEVLRSLAKDTTHRSLAVRIVRLRKTLTSHGLVMHTINRTGYWLDAETKQDVSRLAGL